MITMTEGTTRLADRVLELASMHPGADVDVMATAAGVEDVRTLCAARDDGRIGRLRVVLDAGTLRLRNRAKDGQRHNARHIEEALGADSVRLIRVHAKFARVDGAVLITSANLNRNNRPEQYERGDEFAPMLKSLVDAIFESAPVGCAKPDGKAAYAGQQEALAAAEGRGVRVWRESTPMPNPPDDGLVIVERAGYGAVIDALARRCDARMVWASTWSLAPKDVRHLCSLSRDISVRVLVPARFGRRDSNADAYRAAMRECPDAIEWSPTHSKFALLMGDAGHYMVSGGANWSTKGQLDIIRIRRISTAQAATILSIWSSLPREAAPHGAKIDRLLRAGMVTIDDDGEWTLTEEGHRSL